MTSNTPTDEEQDIDQEKYESLLSIIAHNTGGPNMPVIVRKSAFRLIFCRKRDYDLNDFNTAISKAMEENDLIMQMGSDGDVECALTLSGTKKTRTLYPYRECNIEEFESKVENKNQEANPNKELIKWANQHISHIESDENHIPVITSAQED